MPTTEAKKIQQQQNKESATPQYLPSRIEVPNHPGYLIAYLIPVTYVLGLKFNAPYLLAAYVFICMPVLDLLIPPNFNNILKPIPMPNGSWKYTPLYYRLLILLWFPAQIFCLILGALRYLNPVVDIANSTSFYDIFFHHPLWLMFSTGIVLAEGIVVAHELVHKPAHSLEMMVGNWLLESVSYCHWSWQHTNFHHKYVGLLHLDPATAPYGMTVYRFWYRSIVYTFIQAFQHNRLQTIITAFRTLAIYWVPSMLFGCFPYYIGSAIFGILLLETVNYIEHYGLCRRSKAEPITDYLSYDAPEVWSSFTLFKLTMHSHHHRDATKPYPSLEFQNGAPNLPTGYLGMLIVAMIPPLWFALVNSRARSAMEKRDRALYEPNGNLKTNLEYQI